MSETTPETPAEEEIPGVGTPELGPPPLYEPEPEPEPDPNVEPPAAPPPPTTPPFLGDF